MASRPRQPGITGSPMKWHWKNHRSGWMSSSARMKPLPYLPPSSLISTMRSNISIGSAGRRASPEAKSSPRPLASSCSRVNEEARFMQDPVKKAPKRASGLRFNQMFYPGRAGRGERPRTYRGPRHGRVRAGLTGCAAARDNGGAMHPPGPPPQRKIIHVDMDAFYASVEQRDNPSLRGRPVVVAWRGERSVVGAASYEARKVGVRSAMPALRAERLCPDAVFVPPDFTRYKAVSREVRQIMLEHTDLVEPLSLDEAYLDVTTPKTGLPSATAVAEAIRARIRAATGLTASAGVAPNQFLAKLASDWDQPDGLFIVRPHQVERFLTPLPVGKIPGVGKVMQGKLAELGIATVGDLRNRPLEELQRRFGSFGAALYRRARGI